MKQNRLLNYYKALDDILRVAAIKANAESRFGQAVEIKVFKTKIEKWINELEGKYNANN